MASWSNRSLPLAGRRPVKKGSQSAILDLTCIGVAEPLQGSEVQQKLDILGVYDFWWKS